ncbi:LLM class flavin-dependent oxidoreductase [Salipiger abyssi]|uniref:LLM class flavin-dependent oxidoreductase n=1 Tax=Salipiger abyssi TaxID=1250539 RepID=UPI001A8E416D|nr:LLM class flavin-dependent oxidoreductase [Salipiger abyssi]MBN9887191.1 LLM class flavin-dependent oxidoreductase [Salipiger abyssi]
MSIQVLWNIAPPDGTHPWEPEGRWATSFESVRNLAQEVDTLGFDGVLVAIGAHRIYDGWTLASTLVPMTDRIKFLIAVYPGLISPTQLALMARSFDNLSGGRLMINIVGGNPKTLAAHGFDIPKSERYEMLTEYWNLFKAIYAGEEPPADTRYFKLEDPLSQFHNIPPTQLPHPPLWGAGGSPEGLRAVTGLADVYLSTNDTPQGIKRKMDAATKVAAELHGRTPQLGVSFPVIVRETEEEAWLVAERQLRNTSMKTITGGSGWAAASDPNVDLSDPAVARCVAAIREGRHPEVRDLEVYPNVWCGPNLVNGLDVTRTVPGPGAMLVGSAEQVAERIHEIRDLAGVTRFILSGRPYVEEAYHVSNLLLPLLDLENPVKSLTYRQAG